MNVAPGAAKNGRHSRLPLIGTPTNPTDRATNLESSRSRNANQDSRISEAVARTIADAPPIDRTRLHQIRALIQAATTQPQVARLMPSAA